jgi:hypothetical protein
MEKYSNLQQQDKMLAINGREFRAIYDLSVSINGAVGRHNYSST